MFAITDIEGPFEDGVHVALDHPSRWQEGARNLFNVELDPSPIVLVFRITARIGLSIDVGIGGYAGAIGFMIGEEGFVG